MLRFGAEFSAEDRRTLHERLASSPMHPLVPLQQPGPAQELSKGAKSEEVDAYATSIALWSNVSSRSTNPRTLGSR